MKKLYMMLVLIGSMVQLHAETWLSPEEQEDLAQELADIKVTQDEGYIQSNELLDQFIDKLSKKTELFKARVRNAVLIAKSAEFKENPEEIESLEEKVKRSLYSNNRDNQKESGTAFSVLSNYLHHQREELEQR